jgi:hypothetical protein
MQGPTSPPLANPPPPKAQRGSPRFLTRAMEAVRRLHWSFFLVWIAMSGLGLFWQIRWHGESVLPLIMTITCGWLLSILIDGCVHASATYALGGALTQFFVGALGAVCQYDGITRWRRVVVAASGPLVLLTLAALIPTVIGLPWWQYLVDPTGWRFPDVADGQSQPFLLAIGWVLAVMGLVQWLPIRGSDGYQMLVGIAESFRPASQAIMRVQQLRVAIAAVMVGSGACLLVRPPMMLPWATSIAIGLMLLAFAIGWPAEGPNRRRARPTLQEMGRDSTSIRPVPRALTRRRRQPNALRVWWGRRKVLHAYRREQAEAADEAKLDDILQRLHLHGPQSLQPSDHAILKRTSRRRQQERP